MLAFVGHWATANQKAGVVGHFLSNETRQDVIISCNAVILAVKYMREFCLKEKVRALLARVRFLFAKR